MIESTCVESNIASQTLADAIHNRGINMRYLGKITEMLAKVPQLEYVYVIGVTEVVIRSAKHLFTHYLQGLPWKQYFDNCSVGLALYCI